MLKLLKRIVQDVTTASDLSQALDILVKRVSNAIDADAVSVFLIDNKNAEYVLIATEGLDKKSAKKVRVGLDQGLLGLVGRREEPINLENATEHEAYFRSPFLNEEHLNAFLGVPIIQHRKLFGILLVQQQEARAFDDTEEAFLITLAAQLGGIIANAEATGELESLTRANASGKAGQDIAHPALMGVGSVPGVAIGTAVVVYPLADLDAVPRQQAEDVNEEAKAFQKALDLAREDMRRLSKRVKGKVGDEEHALFDVYLRILDKESLGAKLDALMDLLDNLMQEGRRVLIFSQFTSMLKLIEEAIAERNYSFFKLTGQTQNRQNLVERFQNGEASIFLISLKAGGTGLNLSQADTVIHFDPWWNPAVEDQATDRSHRIGQEKPVFVYKLITVGTVEEIILGMQENKRYLAEGVLSSDAKGIKGLSEEDINRFFSTIES
jgi:phosphotransferase system enzyme I (PtsP)